MCVVSMVIDHFQDKWSPPWWPVDVPTMPNYPGVLPRVPKRYQPWPTDDGLKPVPVPPSPITPAEIAELRKLLDRAREYDKRNSEPDCESADKTKKLLDLVKQLGGDVEAVRRIISDKKPPRKKPPKKKK